MIAVVVTCHNLGRYLDEAVDSVLAQTYQDFEIVIVDDGSTDPETKALLAAYDRPKTRVVHSENRGLPGARNFGIRQSSGELVCALDADDKLEPTWFEKAVRLLDGDPSIAFVSHWLRTFGEEESDWTPTRCDLPAMLLRNLVNGAALVRREPLLAVGGFDESLTQGCEDWDLWLTMLEAGHRGVIIPEVLFFYRRRADSMSRLMMNGNTHARLFRRLVDKHAESYRRFLPDLLAEKDAGMAGLLREVHDLQLEYDTGLAPSIRRAHEELAALEVTAARVRKAQADEEERQRVASRVDELATEREALTAHVRQLAQTLATERASVEEFARTVDSERTRAAEGVSELRAELADVRASLSWRITQPLRSVAGWFLTRGNGTR